MMTKTMMAWMMVWKKIADDNVMQHWMLSCVATSGSTCIVQVQHLMY